jgi:hypothetical protein
MPVLANPKHEAFAQAVARVSSATAAYVEAGYKENRHNAAALARKQHILTRVRAQVTLESLIAEAEAARKKAMSEKGGAAAAVSALIAKAKLAGMWREKVDQHNTGSIQYDKIERVIVEHISVDAAQSLSTGGASSANLPERNGSPPPSSRSPLATHGQG